MKNLLLTLSIALASYSSFAQNSNPWPASGNVGIGTISPATRLHVSGGEITLDAGNAINFNGTASGTTPYIYYNSGSNDLLLRSNVTGGTMSLGATTEAIRILSSGNVGIGTTTPSEKLDVVGGTIQVTNPNPTYGLIDNSNSNYSWSTQNTAGAYRIYDNTANAERFRINSNGNVGIGTTSPGAKLTVAAGDIRIDRGQFTGAYSASHANTGSTNTDFGSSTATSLTGMRINTTWNGTYNDELITFNTHAGGVGAGERMRITAPGNVGIGTTSPGAKLTVAAGDIRIDRGQFTGAYSASHANTGSTNTDFGSSTATSLTGMRINTTWNGTYNDELITFNTHAGGVSAGERMRITASGLVGIGTTSPGYHLQLEGSSNNQLQVTGLGSGYGGTILANIYSERTVSGTDALLKVVFS